MRTDLFNEQLIYIPSSADQVVQAYVADRGLMFGSAEFYGSRFILNLLSVDTRQLERRIIASFLIDQMRQDNFIKGEISMVCGMPHRYITSKCVMWRISNDDRFYERLVEASDEDGSKDNAVFASQLHEIDPLSEIYKLADVGEHLNETDIRQPTQEWRKHQPRSVLIKSITYQTQIRSMPKIYLIISDI